MKILATVELLVGSRQDLLTNIDIQLILNRARITGGTYVLIRMGKDEEPDDLTLLTGADL